MPELLEFLDNHGRTLFRLLYRVTLRDDISEDLMQELFLKLNASESFRSATHPLAYARQTALHLAFDWRRKQSKLPNAKISDDELADKRPSPLDNLVENERVQAVLDAMVGLSPRNCELLTMHYIQQESYEALAKEAGKTPHQIRGLCHKALVQLRELVTETSPRTNRGDKS